MPVDQFIKKHGATPASKTKYFLLKWVYNSLSPSENGIKASELLKQLRKNKELCAAIGLTEEKANQLSKTKAKITWHGLLEVFMTDRTERWWMQAEGV